MTHIRKTTAALATFTLFAGSIAAFGQAIPSATDTFTRYGRAGDWNIFVNNSRGTCLAERVSEESVLQMGITNPERYGYLGVFTKAPTEARSGAVSEIVLEIDGRRFVGGVTEAAGNVSGGFSGGYVVSPEVGFVEAVSAAPSMVATVAGREPLVIDLTGTRRAIDAVRACDAAQAK